MAEITASMVKELRECTGAGMMECKKALSEADGDLDSAVDILRTRGLAALAKKAGRATNEGTIAAFVSADSQGRRARRGQLRDRLRRPQRRVHRLRRRARRAHRRRGARPTSSRLMTQTISARGITVEQLFGEKVSKLGENMGVARFVREEITGTGAVATYIHGGGKIGVLVTFASATPRPPPTRRSRRSPRTSRCRSPPLSRSSSRATRLPADVVEHELSIYKAQAAESGKPEAIQEKMAAGSPREVLQGGRARRAAVREEPGHDGRAVRRRDRQGRRRHASPSSASPASCSASLRPSST